MIIEPLNDTECLGKLTAVASEGATSADVKELAARFTTTRRLAKWIRSLPQRDDTGQADDGPRVMCDVGQRSRIVAPDPNCVERAILYLAAAELIDPGPMRQLATIDVSETMRHTFPLENGEPVVLDPTLRRNALRAHVWSLRNAGSVDAGEVEPEGPIDAEPLVGWLLDLAEDAADEEAGARGVRRVRRARRSVDALLDGGRIHPRDRADVLYALRLAGEVVPWFGESGIRGYVAARGIVARVVTRQTVSAAAVRNVSTERAIYWGGKAVATFYGVGGLYDAAYAEVKQRPNAPRAPPSASLPPAPLPPVAAARVERTEASPAPVLGTLGELEPKKGARE